MRSLNEISHVSGHLASVNRRKAIRLRCIDCSGFNMAEVGRCAFVDCSLHPYRSGSGYQAPAERDKSIREYCLGCMAGQLHEVRLCSSVDCTLHQYRLPKKSLSKYAIGHIGGGCREKIPEAMSPHGGGGHGA